MERRVCGNPLCYENSVLNLRAFLSNSLHSHCFNGLHFYLRLLILSSCRKNLSSVKLLIPMSEQKENPPMLVFLNTVHCEEVGLVCNFERIHFSFSISFCFLWDKTPYTCYKQKESPLSLSQLFQSRALPAFTQPSCSLSSQPAFNWMVQKMYIGRYKLNVRVRHQGTIGWWLQLSIMMGLLEVQDSLGQVDEAAADRSGSQKKVNEGELGGGGELSTVSFQYQNYCRKFDSTRSQK